MHQGELENRQCQAEGNREPAGSCREPETDRDRQTDMVGQINVLESATNGRNSIHGTGMHIDAGSGAYQS